MAFLLLHNYTDFIRKIPAGLGAGEAHGADRTPAGGTGRR